MEYWSDGVMGREAGQQITVEEAGEGGVGSEMYQ
jgi:hypothetical protein